MAVRPARRGGLQLTSTKQAQIKAIEARIKSTVFFPCPCFSFPTKFRSTLFREGDKQIGVRSITFDKFDHQARPPSDVHGSSAAPRTVASLETDDLGGASVD